MTREYYMPGYVDQSPAKEYPPHIAEFKDYLNNIGNFEKTGYVKQSFAPDTSGFAPKQSFAPTNNFSGGINTSNFGGAAYRPETSSFFKNSRPTNTGISYGSVPSFDSFGGW